MAVHTLKRLAPQVIGLLLGCTLGLTAAGTSAVVSDPTDYIPPMGLRMLPLSIRPLTYRAVTRRVTIHDSGVDYLHEYVAADEAWCWATNTVLVDRSDATTLLGRVTTRRLNVLSCSTEHDRAGAVRSFRLMAHYEDDASMSRRVVLYVYDSRQLLEIDGPAERYVRDLERIEHGDESLVRGLHQPTAPN